MRHILTVTALSVALSSLLSAQSPTHLACREASADAFATTPGSWMMQLPGVATDFILAAGGQLTERADGTAHLSALLRRASEIDREFQLDLELNGLVAPGSPNHPPAGALPFDLSANAYVPVGPVDPANFRFYTVGSGSLRGHGAYSGALLTVALNSPLQAGVGANNRNALAGFGGTFTVQLLSQPSFLTLNPTGSATLASTTSNSRTQCVSHVDRDDAVSTGPVRAALAIGGIGNDYVFIPVGDFTENNDGTAVLNGTMRREDDFADRWDLTLQLSSRSGPGDATYPPVEGPVLGLVPTAYVAGGGVVDPTSFRYYTVAVGSLTGRGNNDGGQIDVAAARPIQLGVGANQSNRHFGIYGELTTTLVSNPTSHAVALLGTATLQANIDTSCIIPYPNQTPGLNIVLDNVTTQSGMITGANLAWIEQMTIGTRTITNNPRNWTQGYLEVLSTSQVVVHAPQGMAPGAYQTRVFTRSGAGGFRTMTLNVPNQPRTATAPDRRTGENQDVFLSQGNMPGGTIGGVFYSASNVPTSMPGVGNFLLGNFGSDLNFTGIVLVDPTTKAARFTATALPASLSGLTLYFQAAFLDGATLALPATIADMVSTTYL